jgi:hypothetical protein
MFNVHNTIHAVITYLKILREVELFSQPRLPQWASAKMAEATIWFLNNHVKRRILDF